MLERQSHKPQRRRSGTGLSRRVSQLDDEVFRMVVGAPQDALRLSIGDSEFPPAPCVNRAATKAIEGGETHYPPPVGLPLLREAIARKLRQENGLSYEPNQIVVTPGVAAALSILALALVDPGDEVLIPDPVWFHYSTLVELVGGRPRRVPLDPGDGFRLRASKIEESATSKTKLLIINSPSNPTGRVLSRKELEDAAGAAERLGITVVADEVYEKVVYKPNVHKSIATLSGMGDRTIVVNGFSKGYAMTGWRVGYVASSDEFAGRLASVLGYTLLCAGSVAQHAALEALRNPESNNYTEFMVRSWEKRRNVMMKYVDENRPIVSAMPPEGTFYGWLDVSGSGVNGREAAQRILAEANVGVLPGFIFGNKGYNHVRVSFSASDATVEEGMKRLCGVLHRAKTQS